MTYHMVKMNEIYAKEIMTWRYENELAIYNYEENQETLEELLFQDYYAVLDKKNELVGFFCTGEAAIVPYGKAFHVYEDCDYLDIGLGLNPRIIGKRQGYAFMRFGLDYFKKEYNNNKFRLTVFDFNKRAIHLYHKIGFKIENYFESKIGPYFLVMTLID